MTPTDGAPVASELTSPSPSTSGSMPSLVEPAVTPPVEEVVPVVVPQPEAPREVTATQEMPVTAAAFEPTPTSVSAQLGVPVAPSQPPLVSEDQEDESEAEVPVSPIHDYHDLRRRITKEDPSSLAYNIEGTVGSGAP